MILALILLVYASFGLLLMASLVVIGDRIHDPTLRCPGESFVNFARLYKEAILNFGANWFYKPFAISDIAGATILLMLWPVISFFWIFQLLVDRYANDYNKWIKLDETRYLAQGPNGHYLYNKRNKVLRGMLPTEVKVLILDMYYYNTVLPKRFAIFGLFKDTAFKPDANRPFFDWSMDALQLPELFDPKDRVHLVHIMRKHRVQMSGTRATYAEWASQAFGTYPFGHHYASVLGRFLFNYRKYLNNL